MIISPPFLPSAQANESDADYVRRAMTGDAPESGAYPVSNNLGWHGGLHLEAPMESAARLPVRAIADGKIKYVRQPKAMPDKLDESTQDSLYYHSGWTDNGVVVIEHKTDIGEGAGATNVVFYSIYLHLHSIAQSLPAAGRPVWRKDEIGQAGYIYGKPNLIHFEIICDAENLKKLINRDTGELDTSKDGRTDSVWGEIYVKLPSGAEVKATDPQAVTPAPKKEHAAAAAPPVVASLAPTTEDYFVGIRYDRGHCVTTTYKKDGTLVGSPIDEADYEYKLHEAATKHFKACPSAGYEMLRFGRVLGPDALSPTDAPHWRKISTAGGHGYVNLNTQDAKKFSDADFPEWKNWKLVEDDTEPDDSRCDSSIIRSLINPQSGASTQTTAASTPSPAASAKLHRTICKFPTEWDKATIAARWGWLKDQAKATDAGLAPMSEADFSSLAQHLETLSFWDEADLATIPTPWHFEPREFIAAFKLCSWLSKDELAHLLPRISYVDFPASPKNIATITWTAAQSRWANYYVDFNKMMRKYGLFTAKRQAQFFGQIYIETALLKTMTEIGYGRQNSKGKWPAPAMEFYTVFYGRGMMQLTWAGNYDGYLAFRSKTALPDNTTGSYFDNPPSKPKRLTDTSTHYWSNPNDGGVAKTWFPRFDPEIIVTSSYNACDSAGYYWISKSIGKGQSSINAIADRDFDETSIGRCSVLVNGGGYGYFARQAYARYVWRFRADSTEATESETISMTHGKKSAKVVINYTRQA